MAKAKKAQANVDDDLDLGEEASTETEATEDTDTEAKGKGKGKEGKGGGRAIMLTLSQEVADRLNGGKTEMKRTDYIRARADENATRREIADELTALEGREVPFQIVFAATKEHPAYKDGKNSSRKAKAKAEGDEEVEDTTEDQDAEDLGDDDLDSEE